MWRRRYRLVAAAIAIALGCSTVQDPHPDENPPGTNSGDITEDSPWGEGG